MTDKVVYGGVLSGGISCNKHRLVCDFDEAIRRMLRVRAGDMTRGEPLSAAGNTCLDVQQRASAGNVRLPELSAGM